MPAEVGSVVRARTMRKSSRSLDLEANHRIAAKLRQMADTLSAQGEDGFRVRAYQRAAEVVDNLRIPLGRILEKEGRRGLVALPAIGEGIASAITEMLATGSWSQLERLEGTLDPERLFRTLPGVGPVLAGQIHDDLGVDTLAQLEAAVHDGRLDALPGVGPRKLEMLRATLGVRLGRPPRGRERSAEEPPVALLLAMDALYRRRVAEGALRKIAPRRFNPSRDAWLPVMHAQKEGWQFTVLYSNTARAHELGRTRDWVVLYFHKSSGPERQRTVVTETRGPLKGKRVVRGREMESLGQAGCVEGSS